MAKHGSCFSSAATKAYKQGISKLPKRFGANFRMITKAKVKTRPHDAADYIETPEDAIEHLRAAFEDSDPAIIAEMIGAVARSKGMSQVAEQAGLSRESLDRALSAQGNPTLDTTLRVLGALGLRLSVEKAGTA
ncbi:MAG: addiction module antidote protein [Caulobacterales bacterium]|jgi:probable addiction module antidote protein